MDTLHPCPTCASRRFWFDGQRWRCRRCEAGWPRNVIWVELKPVAYQDDVQGKSQSR